MTLRTPYLAVSAVLTARLNLLRARRRGTCLFGVTFLGGALLSATLFGATLFGSNEAHAQFNTSRAIQRALDTNTRTALERVQVSLAVRDSAGKVVVQKTSRNGRYLLLVFADNRPRVWDLDKSRYWDHFNASGAPIIDAAIAVGVERPLPVAEQTDGA